MNMAFNQLLWNMRGKVGYLLKEENSSIELIDSVPHKVFPSSTYIFIEKFERIFTELKFLQEFIELSIGHCQSSTVKDKAFGLYTEAFSNGLSTVLQNINHQCVAIEESYLSDSIVSKLQVLNSFELIINILPSLSFAVRQVKGRKFQGCPILDLCQSTITSGSNEVENIFRVIQQHCLKQFYKQTKLWIMQAILHDPYGEFFIISVEEYPSISEHTICDVSATTQSRISASPKFKINPDNLPSIIPLSVATKMLFIGEALTICQHHDAESRSNEPILSLCGIDELSVNTQLSLIEKKDYFDLKGFSFLIDDLWINVNKYIRQISDEVGNINYQLNLMWEIYLLGRGELFQEFLLKGSSALNSDVTVVDSRNLNQLFKDAVYYVYLTESSELTDQFFFKLPSKNSKALHKGYTTWSFIELKCKIKWPLHYLFTQDVMHGYNKLFRFLLRLKKAQINVISKWKSINSIGNHSLRMELIEVRMHLLSIVGNLQNYCFTNVIANEMTILFESIKRTVIFTDVQRSLSLFLTNISNRLFLPAVFVAGQCSAANFNSYDTVYNCFCSIFCLCGYFSELDEKRDENILSKLKTIKFKLQKILKSLFYLLQKIDYTGYNNESFSGSHLYSLIMSLDYNGFFRSKFHLDSID